MVEGWGMAKGWIHEFLVLIQIQELYCFCFLTISWFGRGVCSMIMKFEVCFQFSPVALTSEKQTTWEGEETHWYICLSA